MSDLPNHEVENSVEACPHRLDVQRQDSEETATCALLAKHFRSRDKRLVAVRRQVCDACCTAESYTHINPVIASLIYRRATQHLEEHDSDLNAVEFHRLRLEMRSRLSLQLHNRPAGALGVLGVGERRLPAPQLARQKQLTWAIAVLTAPRRSPTLSTTLASLHQAGFAGMHLFAEPNASIPAAFSNLPLMRHQRRQGPAGNFYLAARTLLDQNPDADCYALFEDDISAVPNLRPWSDQQFWPGNHGIVSLYTSRVLCDEHAGWQTLNLGRSRTFGALAFVFQSPTLRAFLADMGDRLSRERGDLGADAFVGEWAFKRGIGIAYHSPSLVQHQGKSSSLGHKIGPIGTAITVEHLREMDAAWERPRPQPGRVGLVGYNTATGLGYQNRDIAIHLPVARWLVPHSPKYARLPPLSIPGEYRAPWRRTLPLRELRAWLDGLDWLLFVEHPYMYQLLPQARELGIRIACVPNWEWLAIDMDWLPFVDLMICPTRKAYQMLRHWRREFGFAWDVVYAPWPIDPQRFAFRRRERCKKFLFVNGTGGVRAWRLGSPMTAYRRKGASVIAATARLLNEIPFVVYSQDTDLPAMPNNVEIRPAPKDNSELYADADICVQPSHWEGLGLQLLECQAAGMPLITTDAAPMNECRPFRAASAADVETVFLFRDQPFDSHCVRPEDLAALLSEVYQTDIREASERARTYVEQERSWTRFRETLAGWLTA